MTERKLVLSGKLDSGIDGLSLTGGKNNTYVGLGAGASASLGGNNAFVGAYSGANATAEASVFLGVRSGRVAQLAKESVFIGYKAGERAERVDSSICIGPYSGQKMKRANNNTIVGYQAGAELTSGSRNTVVGSFAAFQQFNGHDNVCIGHRAGYRNQIGANNCYVGTNSGFAAVSGFENVCLGVGSGQFLTAGTKNVLCGFLAGNAISIASNCIAIGTRAMEFFANGDTNTCLGTETARRLSGNNNTILGGYTASNASGSFNTVVGSRSMNRTNGWRVDLENSVIVGENVKFSIPVNVIGLAYDEALTVPSIVIYGPPSWTGQSTTLAPGAVGTQYSQQVTAASLSSEIAYAKVGSLPTWANVSSSGLISGSPAWTGTTLTQDTLQTTSIVVRAVDAQGLTSDITLSAGITSTLPEADLSMWKINGGAATTRIISGNAYTIDMVWSSDSYPLTFTPLTTVAYGTLSTSNSTTCRLSGIAPDVGTYANFFQYRTRDQEYQFALYTLNITVWAVPPVWVTAELLTAVAKGGAINKQLEATSAIAVTYAKVSGQSWVAVSSSGLLTGTATWTGTTETTSTSDTNYIVIEARDAQSGVSERTFRLPVTSTLPAFSTILQNSLAPNSAIGSRIYAGENNTIDLTFTSDSTLLAISGTTLPFGTLTPNLAGKSCRVSGIAPGAATYSMQIKVRDSEYQILNYTRSIVVVVATYDIYYTVGTIYAYTYYTTAYRTAYRTVYTYQSYDRYYNYYLPGYGYLDQGPYSIPLYPGENDPSIYAQYGGYYAGFWKTETVITGSYQEPYQEPYQQPNNVAQHTISGRFYSDAGVIETDPIGGTHGGYRSGGYTQTRTN